LLFDIPTSMRHLTQGQTMGPRCVIMTGTPSGVGWFMKPSGLLKHRDVVEINIDGIGTIKNRMVFDSETLKN
jgi:2-keto-4-pentenoate hydratase/2-oxohepta-3-ene-1,7-dioic acid hydratase in catechol pathway